MKEYVPDIDMKISVEQRDVPLGLYGILTQQQGLPSNVQRSKTLQTLEFRQDILS